MATGPTAGGGEQGSDWIPDIDTSKPSPARIYDYALGGKDNFAVDREAFAVMAESFPDYPNLAQANRGFLARAVEFMTEAGVDQFIDLGTGIPTSPNVHGIAQRTRPEAKVVYIDNDPIVMTHNRARRAAWPGVITVQHDIREPDKILGDDVVTHFIDFGRPVGLLMVAVLHFVGDELTEPIMTSFREAMAPGSYLAASVATSEGLDLGSVDEAGDVTQRVSMPFTLRNREQIERVFDGFELVEPGVVDVTQWRHEGKPLSISNLAGVGLKR
jgi:hypothetical protein